MLVVHDVKGLCFVFLFFVFCLLVGKGSVFLLGYVVLFVFDCWF